MLQNILCQKTPGFFSVALRLISLVVLCSPLVFIHIHMIKFLNQHVTKGIYHILFSTVTNL